MDKFILIADDHKEITSILETYLLQNGFFPIIASDGEEALRKFNAFPIQLILLDIMMPKKDGYAVLQTIRQASSIPIIMLTAKGEEGDKILGLDYGADDYIVKPFSPKEVIARIHAVLRRVVPLSEPSTKQHLTLHNLSLNLETYQVTIGTAQLNLTKKEIDLLWVLASHPNRVFTRDELLDLVWGYDYYGDMRTVDTHMKRLRHKLNLDEDSPWHIKTIWGVGYTLETLSN
ncbi:MAG: response regulator transcription factor [Niameybacter sp.]|uniref:response regulator transcription factor n=1 Tax=Niameybacter sp. TaxID=2033640 RepID=UPI002FCA1546